MKKFNETITHIETDGSKIISLKGRCKAKDLQKTSVVFYGFDDVFDELGIRRID